jgi:hypothetical protein
MICKVFRQQRFDPFSHLTVALGLTTFESLLPDINQPFSRAGAAGVG